MGRTTLLDCTLRDGGYINDWRFGESTIRGFLSKIARTGVEICEVGFLKGDTYEPDRSVFPDTGSFENVILPKAENMKYVGMLDMSAPVPEERIARRTEKSPDGIRVIFKKDRIDAAYEYCRLILERGYELYVNFVGTDGYSDQEFIAGIEKFNALRPAAISIVDSFGVIKRKQFLHLVEIADSHIAEGIALAYHAHNNLQQAFGNAEALVELELERDVIIDACVFGMGRGAGNLNLELFAELMNENYGCRYQIGPMLEIMDEYLNDIYRERFWGYSLPLYLSASAGCHPNYAIYLAEKNSLTVKGFSELLAGIAPKDKAVFTREKAEKYYREYLENHVDDREAVEKLSACFEGKRVVMLAPGRSLRDFETEVRAAADAPESVVIALNFNGAPFRTDFIFSSNMRRYSRIRAGSGVRCIITSNMKEAEHADYVVNFASYSLKEPDIVDNSGLMLLRLLIACGVKEVTIAGMDGYDLRRDGNYLDQNLEYDFSGQAERRNELLSAELREISGRLRLRFLTPTAYRF